jgi:hypothetical protein
MPRYVVLEHDHPFLHWDLMLEAGHVLRTWRLSQQPQAGVAVAAKALFDHRLAYLDYEGAIAGDRGRVSQWDKGTFELTEETEGRLIIQIKGAKLVGKGTLERQPDGRWRFVVEPPYLGLCAP